MFTEVVCHTFGVPIPLKKGDFIGSFELCETFWFIGGDSYILDYLGIVELFVSPVSLGF